MFFFHCKRQNSSPCHPIDPQSIIRRLTPCNHPDASGFLIQENGSLLVQCVYWNTPQSHFEKTPLHHAPSQTDAAAWARLDNREELAHKLAIAPQALKSLSDTELILWSYLKWQEGCVDYLIGDFVFVIHDRKQQKVFCGRDHMGVRPFYYFLSDDAFVCATTLAAFLGLKCVPIRIRQQWVAEYLMRLSMSFEDTAYEGIKKLPPAHCLTVAAQQMHLRQYFQLSATPELKLKGTGEYVEAYRAVLETAVKCRLESDYNLGSELSGGLDSSTITAFAAKSLGNSLPRLHTFAFAFSELEPQYIQAVIEGCHLPNNHVIAEQSKDYQDSMQRSLNILGCPVEHGNATLHETFYQLAERLNVRTLLSGFGGDEFGTTIHGYMIPMELIMQRRYWKLFNILPGNFVYRFLRLTKMEWRRRKTQNFRLPAFNPRFHAAFKSYWPHLIVRDEFVKRYNLEERYFNIARFDAGYTNLKRFTLERRWMPFVPTRMENCALMASGRKIEYSWPLLDVRLVKLFLSIPSEENFFRGMGRYLHRRAIDGVVPEMAAWKKDKNMGSVSINAQQNTLGELAAARPLHPAMEEFVNMVQFERQIKDLPHLMRGSTLDGRKAQINWNIRAVSQVSAWIGHLENQAALCHEIK
jgi:asparagine synthase (glutamine-hydrolysing)